MEAITELLTPVNAILTVVIAFLTWKLFGPKKEIAEENVRKVLPKMKRKDYTLRELKEYNGEKHDGRILIGVNGTVFDVTRGSNFYGPGGPYSAMAGRDASRMLATFDIKPDSGDEPLVYDDLSDLTTSEMGQVKEWYVQFCEKYEVVGKLLKPGEEPTDYEEENEDGEDSNAANTSSEQQAQKKH